MQLGPADAVALEALLGAQRAAAEASQLREFAAVVRDPATAAPVGYIALDAAPAVCNSSSSSPDARCSPGSCQQAAIRSAELEKLGYGASTTAFVQRLHLQDGGAAAGPLRQLLQHAFLSMPHLQHLLLVSREGAASAAGEQQLPSACAELFSAVAQLAALGGGAWLHECSRQAVLPPLQVRLARIEDHDDLLPLVAASAAGPCPSLAALPESCQPEEPFALTRLIGSQDSQNLVLVAEDAGKLVGLLVATCELDVSLLLQEFDVGPFDGFLTPELYEECEAAARHAAAEKAQQEQQQEQQAEGGGGSDVHGVDPVLASPAAEPSAEQVRRELVPLLVEALAKQQHAQQHAQRKQQKQPLSEKAAVAPPAHSLVAITMLCMLPGYEARAVELMPLLFEELPGKECCALTLPHAAAQPALAQHTTALQPWPGVPAFPQVVLLLHRASLVLQAGASWEVRLALPDDMMGLHALTGGLSNAGQAQEHFLHAVGARAAVVALVNGELVGALAASPCSTADLDRWRAAIRLQALPPGVLASAGQHARLQLCVVSPVFAACTGALLAGALRLLDKACLHYVTRPEQPVPPEVLAVMQQQPSWHSAVRPPQQQQQQQQEQHAALFTFTRAMAYVPKQGVNARLVIAGASETGLALLEALLQQPRVRFTSITLLAPGGVLVGGMGSELSAARLAAIGLEASVTVVDSHMVALEARERVVLLADGSQLAYDVLAVTTGLQDQLSPALVAAFPEAAHFVLSAQQLACSSIARDVAETLSSVLVYGGDLAALEALSALTGAGVNPDAITWLCPGSEQEAPSTGLLRSLVARVGIELPEPQQGRLLGLSPSADGSRAVAELQAGDAGDDAGPMQQIEIDLLVGAGRRGPSAAVASCLAGTLVVWDGRLVVDAAFGSSIDGVLGAGPVAKFSRRYTLPEVQQAHCNSCELGAALAEAILRRVGASATAASGSQQQGQQPAGPEGQQPAEPDRLPALQRGKVVGCRLPGGQLFVLAGSATAIARPQLAPPAGGCSLISTAAGGSAVVNICLDAADTIHHIAYVGGHAGALEAGSLARLVGLPFSFVAGGLLLPDRLSAQLQAGAVVKGVRADPAAQPGVHVYVLERDVLDSLAQPWVEMLLSVLQDDHDSLLQGGAAHEAGALTDVRVLDAVQKACGGQLPGSCGGTGMSQLAGPARAGRAVTGVNVNVRLTLCEPLSAGPIDC